MPLAAAEVDIEDDAFFSELEEVEARRANKSIVCFPESPLQEPPEKHTAAGTICVNKAPPPMSWDNPPRTPAQYPGVVIMELPNEDTCEVPGNQRAQYQTSRQDRPGPTPRMQPNSNQWIPQSHQVQGMPFEPQNLAKAQGQGPGYLGQQQLRHQGSHRAGGGLSSFQMNVRGPHEQVPQRQMELAVMAQPTESASIWQPQAGGFAPPMQSPMVTATALAQPVVPGVASWMEGISHAQTFRQIQTAALKILEPCDVTHIKGKTFIKKSGWRKISLFFNISTEVKDANIQYDQNGNVLRASFTVRALMTSGRFADGWGSCDRGEGSHQKPNHTIPAIAETRATNRAVQNVTGVGEATKD